MNSLGTHKAVMLTLRDIEALRDAAFADDVDIPDDATSWTEDEVRSYFESGGSERPMLRDCPVGPLAPTPAPPLAMVPRRAPSRPARFLCLHGGGGNKLINNLQTAYLRMALGGPRHVSFEYLEGTRVWDSADVDQHLVKAFGSGPYYGWYGVTNDANARQTDRHSVSGPSGGMTYYEAMFDQSVNFTYVECEAALDRVEAHVEANGPYDALLGFSQGAIVVTMLTARRLERWNRGEAPPPSWLCNVLLSGMAPRAGPYRPWPAPAVPYVSNFPVISCIGTKDTFYEYAKLLRHIHDRLEWYEHPGGHEASKDPALNAKLASAVWSAMGGAPADAGGGGS